MKRPLLLGMLAAVLCLTAACAARSTVNPDAPPRFVAGESRILLMPISVELFEFTASGLEDPRADWSETARAHVETALQAENESRGLSLVSFELDGLELTERHEVDQIIKLHQAVGAARLEGSFYGQLPTKSGPFDWSLGPGVARLSPNRAEDYALFLYLRDSYSSPGRVVLNIVTGILGLGVRGGRQVGYATLIDLETGDLSWFAALVRGEGDLRGEEKAREAIGILLKDLPDSG